jgi:uncharacterized protein YqgC (DUF456 family)
MDWVYYLALIALLFCGLFVNLLGLPGLWLMVGAHAAFGWATGWNAYIGRPSVIATVVLAGIAEVVEFVAGAAGSKAAGGSKRGMIGAIVGGLLGGFFLTFLVPIPILGTVVGVCVGTFIGALVVELMVGKEMGKSTEIGIGAAKGRFLGILAKTAFGIAILLVSVITAWPTGRAAPIVPGGPVTPPTTVPTTAPTTATAPTTLPTTTPAVER